jgi:FKBP-type peptidyl-prolyl cis-trans isomerase FkpA
MLTLRSLFHVLQLLVLLLLLSCDSKTETVRKAPGPTVTVPEIKEGAVRDQFIKANQQLMQKENDEMDQYARSHKMPFVRTPSGIRYHVYKPSAKGDSIRDSTWITMSYELRLLNGKLCYSSKTDGKKTFMVGHEDIESGIHKGVKYLKKGDKALLLIPSPLAHGLLGDMKKIPPQMPILYDVQIEN